MNVELLLKILPVADKALSIILLILFYQTAKNVRELTKCVQRLKTKEAVQDVQIAGLEKFKERLET